MTEINRNYAVFISYSHTKPDRRWAQWLQRSIETYRLPRDLGHEGSNRTIGRVFRDEEELTAASSLSMEINTALEHSEWLVVIASPRARLSPWVTAEVTRFRSLGRSNRVLAILVDGAPEEAFPEALHDLAQGKDPLRPGLHDDPFAPDVRDAVGWRGRRQRREALLRIVAAVVGCRFDDLQRRDRIRAKQRSTVAIAAVVLGLVVLGAVSAKAIHSQRIVLDQQREAAALAIVSRMDLDLEHFLTPAAGAAAFDLARAEPEVRIRSVEALLNDPSNRRRLIGYELPVARALGLVPEPKIADAVTAWAQRTLRDGSDLEELRDPLLALIQATAPALSSDQTATMLDGMIGAEQDGRLFLFDSAADTAVQALVPNLSPEQASKIVDRLIDLIGVIPWGGWAGPLASRLDEPRAALAMRHLLRRFTEAIVADEQLYDMGPISSSIASHMATSDARQLLEELADGAMRDKAAEQLRAPTWIADALLAKHGAQGLGETARQLLTATRAAPNEEPRAKLAELAATIISELPPEENRLVLEEFLVTIVAADDSTATSLLLAGEKLLDRSTSKEAAASLGMLVAAIEAAAEPRRRELLAELAQSAAPRVDSETAAALRPRLL